LKKIKYPSSEDVEWAHNRILDLTGGERGDLAKANLEFVLDRMKEIGERLGFHEAIVKKAAFLLHSLVTQHPFINGNKRTAFEALKVFLEPNGYIINASDDEIYTLLGLISKGQASLTQVEEWMETNLAKNPRRSN